MEGHPQDINTPHCRLALICRMLPKADRKDTGVPGRLCQPLGNWFRQLQVRSGGLREHNSSISTPGFPNPSPRASAAGRRIPLCSQRVKSRCWSCRSLKPARLADFILSSLGVGTTTMCKQGCKQGDQSSDRGRDSSKVALGA